MRRIIAVLVGLLVGCPWLAWADGFKRDSGYQADRSEWIEETAVVSLRPTTNNAVIGGTTAGGKLFIDGDTDEIQLQVQGFSTQTTLPLVVENSAGTDQFTVSNSGALVLLGTQTFSDDQWLGLGSAAGRIEFDDQATDEVNILDANVGIGTTSPGQKLHVYAATGDVETWLQTAGVDSAPILRLQNDAQNWAIFNDGADADKLKIRDSTAGSTLVTIVKSTGNVGIGTTAPLSLLHIGNEVATTGNLPSSSNTAVFNLAFTPSASVNGPANIMLHNSQAWASGGAGFGGRIGFSAMSNTTQMATIANIEGLRENSTAGNFAGYLALGTRTGAGSVTEAVRIDSSQNVGIGTTSPQSTLHVPDGKYAQFEDNNAGAPAAADCDADAERGRLSIDTTNNRLYVCNGATRGWDYVALTD